MWHKKPRINTVVRTPEQEREEQKRQLVRGASTRTNLVNDRGEVKTGKRGKKVTLPTMAYRTPGEDE